MDEARDGTTFSLHSLASVKLRSTFTVMSPVTEGI